MVVTVTVWLGWSHCMDSDFAVSSRSRSSPPQTTSLSLAVGLCKYSCGPTLGDSSALLESLLDLLHDCLLLLHLTLWKSVRYTTAQLFLVGAEHEPRWSPSRFFLLPPLPGRPARVPTHKDEGCNGFLYTYLATLLYCFIVSNSFLTGSLQFLHKESYHLQKG